MTRNILVAVPNYSGSLKGEMADSLLQAQAEAMTAGWGFDVKRLTGGYHHFARNTLMGAFHAEKRYTDLVWWDDDVAITPGAFVPFVEHDVDFVCAAYRHKRDDMSYPGEPAPVEQRKMHTSASTGTPLFNTLYWVIGLSRQTRACVDKMLADPSIEWDFDDLTKVDVPYVFTEERLAIMPNGKKGRLTEDYIYCRRWIDQCGEVWLDPMMMTGHAGNQCWWGRIADLFAQQVEQHRLSEAMKKMGAAA